jgi:SAM-dependent methyltransferase
MVDALLGRELLPAAGRVRALEVGAGLGYVARDVLQRMRERGLDVSYDIIELSPALAAAQRERLQGTGATVREGDILAIDLPGAGAGAEAGFDFVLANEMISDLPAVELTRAQAGLNEPQGSAERQARQDELGEVGRLIRDHALQLDDAPDPFYLTTGALSLLGRLWSALAPGGAAVITEFGELTMYPRLSTQLDHFELSIHFGHLERAARSLGFETHFEFIIDLLDFDRTLEGMATTRSYFRALGVLLGEYGIDLPKLGYTREMFDELIAGKLGDDRIGELYFDRIEDRLMGLVPHEFKALILKRPAAQ